MKKTLIIAIITFVAAMPIMAQNGTSDVHLFQSFFYDAPIAPNPYVEAGFMFNSFDGGSVIGAGAQGGYGINDKIEVNAGWGFESWNPDQGDGQSGITDLDIYGRYNVLNGASPTKISAGAMVSLPIGEEKIGESHLNFGGFGALRHALESGLELTANIGIFFYETTKYEWNATTMDFDEKTEYENTIGIGAGAIYPINDQMHAVGEFYLMTEGDYMALSAGIDYIMGKGRVRGAILLGLDDGAPDFGILGSYLLTL